MKAGFVISHCLPDDNDDDDDVSDEFPKHPVSDFLLPKILIFAKNTCFLSRSRDFFRTRDVCFFLINLSGARCRLLICSVWTDLNTKIKIFKIRRQNPEPEPTVYTRPDTPGVKIQEFFTATENANIHFEFNNCRKYKRFSCVNIVRVRAQFMFCSESSAVKNLKWFINSRLQLVLIADFSRACQGVGQIAICLIRTWPHSQISRILNPSPLCNRIRWMEDLHPPLDCR